MVHVSGTDFSPICPKLYVSDVISIWHLYLSYTHTGCMHWYTSVCDEPQINVSHPLLNWKLCVYGVCVGMKPEEYKNRHMAFLTYCTDKKEK